MKNWNPATAVIMLLLFICLTATMVHAQWKYIDARLNTRNAALTYDESRHVFVLICQTGESSTQLWEYNGKGWYLAADPGPEVGNARIVYFPPFRCVVIVGGVSPQVKNNLTAIWTWDGVDVRLHSIGGPRQRHNSSLVYSPVEESVYLHGGHSDFTVDSYSFSDTWRWDGSSWHFVNQLGEAEEDPYEYDLVFDKNRGNILLFDSYSYLSGYARIVRRLSGKRWIIVAGAPSYSHLFTDTRTGAIYLFVTDYDRRESVVWQWDYGILKPSGKPYDELGRILSPDCVQKVLQKEPRVIPID